MASLFKKAASSGLLGGGVGAYATNKGFRKGVNAFLGGTPEIRENVSTLRPEQEPLYEQAVNAGLNKGAGGAFGDSADYYRNLLSDDSADYNQFAAPQLRQFNEEIIPGLSEQFAGMGAGGLSSSGFRNAAVNAGTDLSERLGAIRANLRHSGAQGLTNIGQIGLGNYSQNMVTEHGTQGLLPMVANAAGNMVAQGFGGGGSGGGGGWMSKGYSGGNNVGANRGPYQGGNGMSSSPKQSNFQLPNRGF